VVRGTADEEFDVDLLIVLREPAGHPIRDRISSVILDINLEYDSNLSGLVVDRGASPPRRSIRWRREQQRRKP
jgi:predicted nucleotidyltransferase